MDSKIVFFVAFALLVSAPAAIAQDSEKEMERNGVEREVKVEADDEKVKIESSVESESGENESESSFEVDFSVQMDPRIELKHESSTETADSESENESSMEVRFRSIVEFEDKDGDREYDQGEEVSRYDLRDVSYTPPSTTERTVDGNTVHVIESSSTDGVFTVRLHAVGDFTKLGSEQVSPTEVKIDLEMHNYSYTENDTRLALETEVSSEREFETETGDDEESVEVEHDGASTFYSWKKQAVVDGETTTVESSQVESEEDEKTVYLSYERGSSIVHDPKIGIETGDNGRQSFLAGFFRFLNSIFSGLF